MVCSFKWLKLLLVQFQFRDWRCFSSPWYGSITGASHGGSLDCRALTRICKVQTKGCITLTMWCRLKLQHRQQGQWTVETKDLRIDIYPGILFKQQHMGKNWNKSIKSEKSIMQEVQANISCLLPDALNPQEMWDDSLLLWWSFLKTWSLRIVRKSTPHEPCVSWPPSTTMPSCTESSSQHPTGPSQILQWPPTFPCSSHGSGW